MKILFISKDFFMEPLGLMYLSAAAKQAGHQVELDVLSGDLEKRVLEYKPEVIGYSVITGDQNTYLETNRKLKKFHEFTSLFGGPHSTFFPEIIKEEGVDLICMGEGEEAFTELLNNLEKGDDISQIENIGLKNPAGEITINPVRPLSDIDSLPFPDRSLLDKFQEVRHGPIKHFLASRGCPFSCAYCFNEQYFEIYDGKGKRTRHREVTSLVDEIKEVINSSPTRFIYFQDDTFSANKSWLKEFAEEYSKRIALPFHCHVRPNTINEESINALKKAGCYSVHIAAETADDRLRNEILQRKMSKEQIINASRMLRKNNIKIMLQNMIGLPTGSLEEDIKTLELNIECKPDYAWVSIYQPYPGTKLGEFCEENGLYTGDFSDLGSNFFDSSKLNFSREYKTQISYLQKLFAIFVEYPKLHELGLSRAMINLPNTKELNESYRRAYKEFRKIGDERLYGFKL